MGRCLLFQKAEEDPGHRDGHFSIYWFVSFLFIFFLRFRLGFEKRRGKNHKESLNFCNGFISEMVFDGLLVVNFSLGVHVSSITKQRVTVCLRFCDLVLFYFVFYLQIIIM